MLHFEGTELIPASPAEVFAYLADPGRLARVLPDHEVTAKTADAATWKVRPKFSFMAGTLDTTATLVNRSAADQTVSYRIVSVGVGSSSTMDTRLVVSPALDGAGGTQVRWTGDLVDLGGLLKIVPRGMLQTAALKTITDLWAAIRKDLTAPASC
jgi:carbon monoxide dehydrogenase subunit G